MAFRLGVDVGGTFTDLLLVDESSGQTYMAKVLSTPEDSIIEFLAYLRCTNKETPVYALSADYASSTAFKELKFDMVDVLNSCNHTTQSLTSQRDSIIAPRVVQPKIFHNFCLN